MKTALPLLAISVLVFSSCTTAYKSGQTPDDVYYSPASPQDEYQETEKERSYRYEDAYYDNRYLRMKVRNRYRWYDLDSWYGYDRYSIGYNYYYGNYYNPFNTWHYYYNPYCTPVNYVYYHPKIPVTQPVVKRPFSLAGYTNTNFNNSNNTGLLKSPRTTTTRPVYDNTNYSNNNGLGSKVKTIFSGDNSGSGSSRTYKPSSGTSGEGSSRGSSSGSSGGKSGGAVTRPTRN